MGELSLFILLWSIYKLVRCRETAPCAGAAGLRAATPPGVAVLPAREAFGCVHAVAKGVVSSSLTFFSRFASSFSCFFFFFSASFHSLLPFSGPATTTGTGPTRVVNQKFVPSGAVIGVLPLNERMAPSASSPTSLLKCVYPLPITGLQTQWRHQDSARQHAQKVAGCRPERTMLGCSDPRSTPPSVFSSRFSVAKGISTGLASTR